MTACRNDRRDDSGREANCQSWAATAHMVGAAWWEASADPLCTATLQTDTAALSETRVRLSSALHHRRPSFEALEHLQNLKRR